jgi:16S rRNA (guanine527-N7)-methyltransferase
MNMLNFGENEVKIWKDFVGFFNLSQEQDEKLKKYLFMLLEENEKINLTTITSIQDVIQYHFADSLMLSKFFDFNSVNCICDVGCGAGFPGIPLKILNPKINLILIEVVNKKVKFLEKVIEALGLENSQVSNLDWRTFLRQEEHEIDLFCARASLAPEELVRIFKPSSRYKNATFVYWASIGWELDGKLAPLVKKQEAYKVGEKNRKFVFFES